MKETLRQITAGLFAAGSLIILFIWFDYAFWFKLGISAAIGLGVYFSIPQKKEAHEIEIASGVSQADLDSAIAKIGGYREKFNNAAKICNRPKTAQAVRTMASILGKIAGKFRDEPENLKNASPFLNQYMEMSYNIVDQYTRLAAITLEGEQEKQLAATEKTIGRIHKGFKEFYNQCIANDLADLEVSSATFSAIFETDLANLDIDKKE